MISAKNLCKNFYLYQKPSDRLKELLFSKKYYREHCALNNVSFEVGKGETFGIIGNNGSGKSTLLKIITGIILPDSGVFSVEGKITGLLELGTGFNFEFTGLENIYMNATYIGLSKKEIDSKLYEIVEFTELGEFIDKPIKTYSSGMLMRLAFSVAYHADPSCFVVDEALAVGDARFQQKCIKTLKNFKKKGGSIVLVSHDLNAVKILCERVMLMDKGEVLKTGDPEEVINTYNLLLAARDSGEFMEIAGRSNRSGAYGSRKTEFETIEIKNRHGRSAEVLASGAPCCIEIGIRAKHSLPEITVGIMIRDRFGQDIFGANTYYLGKPLRMEKDEARTVKYHFRELNIGPGKYTLSVAAHSGGTHINDCYQWLDRICGFEVVAGDDFIFSGVARLAPEISVQ